jgi:hypothetical protein
MKSSMGISIGALLCVGAMGLYSAPARAEIEGTYKVIIKKQEEKKQSRWTLAEWLALKERNRQMDLWLAHNSQSDPFEFYLDLSSRSEGFKSDAATASGQTVNEQTFGGSFAAYATVAGLRGSYEAMTAGDGSKRTTTAGSLNLRILGRAIQDSHLNLEYGIRGLALKSTAGAEENFQSQFGGGTLTLYFTKHFGVDGTYHRYLKSEPSSAGRTAEGDLAQSSVFIDFSFVRVFGSWRKERLEFAGPSATTTETIEGFGGGLRFFF